MTVWQWPGLIALDAPDDWTVSEADGIVEIQPERGEVAAHVSFARRAVQSVAGEAKRFVERFAAERGAADVDATCEDVPGGERCHATVFDDAAARHVHISFTVWPDLAVMATANSTSADELQTATAMLSTIRRV